MEDKGVRGAAQDVVMRLVEAASLGVSGILADGDGLRIFSIQSEGVAEDGAVEDWKRPQVGSGGGRETATAIPEVHADQGEESVVMQFEGIARRAVMHAVDMAVGQAFAGQTQNANSIVPRGEDPGVEKARMFTKATPFHITVGNQSNGIAIKTDLNGHHLVDAADQRVFEEGDLDGGCVEKSMDKEGVMEDTIISEGASMDLDHTADEVRSQACRDQPERQSAP